MEEIVYIRIENNANPELDFNIPNINPAIDNNTPIPWEIEFSNSSPSLYLGKSIFLSNLR